LSDAQLDAYARNDLTDDDRRELGAHMRACERCHGLTATLADTLREQTVTVTISNNQPYIPRRAPRPPQHDVKLERGATIGRYTILSLIGSGGMGEVYAAYDPELDRKVALKLIGALGAQDERSHARLLREAKSTAKLSHANVVVVHDAGTYLERVFVAMEFVDGLTIKDWLAAARRSRAEILAVYVAAARGLAAAHAAGLVHRDFKPHNVMVGKDGEVRVMDFGLAREIATGPQGDADADAPSAPRSLAGTDLAGGLTLTGELIGTPLYMAPEQFQGQRTDARTDQFSFCVALYQSLYGEPPFGKRSTLDELIPEVLAGHVRPPPAKHDVPTWLRRVLLRGLSVDPAMRWPSMPAVIEALEQDPARARRRWATTAGVVLLAAVASAAVVRGGARSQTLCLGGPARLEGVWEPPGAAARPRRDALRAAFTAASAARGPETWAHVEPLLDRYATGWLTMYRDTCEATHARGEQSAQTLDLRMSCLDGRRTALAALTNIFAAPDEAVLAKAVDATNRLPALDRCGDLKMLRTPIEPPRDEAQRQQVEALRKRAAEAKALGDTGRYRPANELAHTLTAQARELGYRPFLAEALLLEGELKDKLVLAPEAARMMEEAAWVALSVHADELAFEAAAYLTAVTGYTLARHEEGWRWSRLAHSLLERLGPGPSRDVVHAWLLQDESNIKTQEHDAQSALDLSLRALALKEKALPVDHPDIGITVVNVAIALTGLRRYEEALPHLDRAQGIFERAYGKQGFEYARTLDCKVEALLGMGRAREAEPLIRQSVAAWQEAVGAKNMSLGFPLTNLGRTLLALDRPGEAIEPLRRAIGVREENESDPNELAASRFELARALRASRRDAAEASALAAKAREVLARAAASGDAEAKRSVVAIDAWIAAGR
jgi:tetratricopeptide (TPR) repeat protein